MSHVVTSAAAPREGASPEAGPAGLSRDRVEALRREMLDAFLAETQQAPEAPPYAMSVAEYAAAAGVTRPVAAARLYRLYLHRGWRRAARKNESGHWEYVYWRPAPSDNEEVGHTGV